MIRDEILNMPAGREMDALVAEKVMGWTQHTYHSDCVDYYRDPSGKQYLDTPDYSTDIAAAWQVVEKMIEDGDLFIEFWSDGEWFVANKPIGVRDDAITAMCDGRATGNMSAPLAICRAALLAVMEI